MATRWRVPTARNYGAAFSDIRDNMTAPEFRMLEAHYLAPQHRITSGELAHAAGYRSFEPANTVYSNLARKLRRSLGLPLRDGSVLTYAFCEFPEKTADGRWVFSLRQPAAAALGSLGWFDDSESDSAVDAALLGKVAREGRLIVGLQRHRHRERSLRRAKLRQVLATAGRLACEVRRCGFDFEQHYGSLGRAFAEVHHLVELSQDPRPRETSLDDLAVVCSNCHSMIHRDGGCRTLEEVDRCLKKGRPNKRMQRTKRAAQP